MNNFETLILLMFAAILLIGVSQKLRIPYPVALVIGGAAIGFIPGVRPILFDPSLILTIVLPPLLYYAAFWTSYREFRHNLKDIFSLALGLVIITTFLIGSLFHWLFPEIPVALAFVFGAIVSPPDAVAATTILKRFAINTRLLSVLEGESLINDASAIILYKLAITSLLMGSFSLGDATADFFKVSTGGILVGVMIGFLIQTFTRRFLDPVVGVVFSFVNPYLTYILAEKIGVSGVLAVVVNGLIGSYLIIKHQTPLRRVLGYTSWDIFNILLNCFVFILIGSQLRTLTENMTTSQMILYTQYGFLITFVMIIIRTLWVFIERILVFFLSNLPKQIHHHKQSIRDATILSWSGMRGIVSLAAALALPFTFPNGMPIVGRDIVVFITFIVILLTLIIPALTLPTLLSWWKIHQRPKVKIESSTRKQLMKAAEIEINRLYSMDHIDEEERSFLISYFNAHQRIFELTTDDEQKLHRLESARIKALHVQRKYLFRLWENEEIDDKILRLLERELDIEEALSARAEIK